MEAKQKANILVNQFYSLTASFDNSQTKQCALICVDEKIDSLEKIKHPTNSKQMNRRIDRNINILEEVKDEIKKL